MRGFYRVKAEVFKKRRDPAKTLTPGSFGCVVLHKTTKLYILHSATNPNTALEDVGGVLLAGDWPGLKGALTVTHRDHVFMRRVRRSVTLNGGSVERTVTVSRAGGMEGDVIEQDWMPPHSFLGDPEPEPVP